MDYTPENLAVQIAQNVGVTLAYISAALGAGVLLMLAFLGIRKAFEFFFLTADPVHSRGSVLYTAFDTDSSPLWSAHFDNAQEFFGYDEVKAAAYADKVTGSDWDTRRDNPGDELGY